MSDDPANDPEADLYKQSELYKELAAYYDNPDSFFNADLPFVHNFRLGRIELPDRPDLLRIEVEGRNLFLNLREAFFGMMKTHAGRFLLNEYETDDWNSVRSQIEADSEYLELERDMYWLFAVNMPPLFVKLYNTLLVVTLFSATRKVIEEKERIETDKSTKLALAAALKDLERDLKRILNLRSKKRGRPLGSKKSPAQRAKEAREFESQIESTIRKFLETERVRPTKTAVAKALGLGGLSARTGVDTSLSVFINKLKRLGLDYDVIADRVNK
jgi:hypothetical protein